MLDLRVDADKCIRCGECAADCPYLCIALDGGTGDGLPAAVPGREIQCIDCGHCLAVCPTGALSVMGQDPARSRPLAGALPDPEALETLVMGRRSVRRYTAEPVAPEMLERLLRAVGHAPTGVNNRALQLTVVDGPQQVALLRGHCLEAIARAARNGSLPPRLEFFTGFVDLWERKGVDVLLRNAPHLLIATSPAAGPTPEVDCHIALATFDLLATGLGLGTLWNGLVHLALTVIAPELRPALGIPADHGPGYCMTFGHPAVRYARTVQRSAPRVHRAVLG
jgi:nitroreductase/NAD-dependent dihydropyrimidine dehydrogenase PreA subunit